jgi:hypothetical protein
MSGNYMDNFLDWLESTTPEERLGRTSDKPGGLDDGSFCIPGCPDDVCRMSGHCAWSPYPPYRSLEVSPADGTITVVATSWPGDQIPRGLSDE